ncbi:MAG TPA: hypothetical protein VJN18_30360 [Polyangiaceae bacterium]|nr:hypothetical protein [Polyangiaceae bacterium]
MRKMKNAVAFLALCSLAGCSGAEEAKRVERQVVTGCDGLAVTTDLGYEVELTSARMVADDLQFTIAGESHTSMWRRLSNWVVPIAQAHPGHFQGGEVTGELPGHFVLRFEPSQTYEVGIATLLVGTYQSVNLTLASASTEDVEKGDPMLEHTAYLSGIASSQAGTWGFEVVLDSPAGRQLIGILFEEKVAETTAETLALHLSPLDRLENDTLLDGVDFAALDADADGHVLIDSAATDEAVVTAYNLIHRVFQSHDHFMVQPKH